MHGQDDEGSDLLQDVCSDRTGPAEVVQVEFDPSKVAYDALHQVFWKSHDPTTGNRPVRMSRS